MLLALATLLALVLVPFLFWRGTWFGRPLTNGQIEEYLNDNAKPRHVQHALAQLSTRIERGDRSVERWYPRLCALASSPVVELRVTDAWLMGQDNQSSAFHQTLLNLLGDPEPLVRRNAALSLARFGDAAGRPELDAMLRPFALRAPASGVLRYRLNVRDEAERGTVVARVETGRGETVEVRAGVPGKLQARIAGEGAPVTAGEEIARLEPSADHVWEALRALYLVGTAEDLSDVERYVRPLPAWPARIAEQAKLTAQQIRARAGN
ncbi:MAG TPA: HEAT repeat domain-containing protein [Bryobacterales bacterium]|nr:HEAT repeat domain-containing protein [Bryobacterales bacterium]